MGNIRLFELLNASGNIAHWKLAALIAIATGLIYIVPLALVAAWLRGDAGQRRALLEMLLAVGLALGIGQAITMLWPQPRPFMVHLGTQFIAHAADRPAQRPRHCSLGARLRRAVVPKLQVVGAGAVSSRAAGRLEPGRAGGALPLRRPGRLAGRMGRIDVGGRGAPRCSCHLCARRRHLGAGGRALLTATASIRALRHSPATRASDASSRRSGKSSPSAAAAGRRAHRSRPSPGPCRPATGRAPRRRSRTACGASAAADGRSGRCSAAGRPASRTGTRSVKFSSQAK
jgi:hypothetical protein